MYQNRVIFIIIILYTFVGKVNGQTIDFFKTYNFSSANSIDLISDNSYVIAGNDNFNAYLLKVDTLGNTIWSKSYGSIYKDAGYEVQKTYDDGFILVGQIGEPDTTGELLSDIYVIKTNSLGDTTWTIQWNAGTGDRAFSVKQTLDSNYIIAGVIDGGLNMGIPTAFLLKLNNNGDTLWSRLYEKSSEIKSIIQTSDGGFIFCGRYGYGFGEVYIVKTNGYGDIIWSKKGNLGFSYGRGEDILETSDSSFIVTGSAYNNTNQNVFISKIDQSGNLIWTKEYGGVEDDYASSIDKVGDMGFVVTGSTFSYSSGQFTNSDIWLLQINENGDTLWTKTYGDTENNEGNAVKVCSDGGFAIVGYTGIQKNAFLLKTDSIGNAPFSTLTENMNVINNTLRVFPIPAKNSVIVEFDIEKMPNPNVEIVIYNVLGRKVKEIKKMIHIENNAIQIETNMLEKGVYFLNINFERQTITKKIIIK